MTLRKLWTVMTGRARLPALGHGTVASPRVDGRLLDDMGILWCDVAYDREAGPHRH